MDPLLLAAGGIVACLLLWAWFGGRSTPPTPSARPLASTTTRTNPGRSMIDNADEMGRDGAGLMLVRAFALVEAEEYVAKHSKAMAKLANFSAGPITSPNP